MRSCVSVFFTSVQNYDMQVKTTIHQHALINLMPCSKKKKGCNQIICWCDQLRKLVAPVQPVEKLVWRPAGCFLTDDGGNITGSFRTAIAHKCCSAQVSEDVCSESYPALLTTWQHMVLSRPGLVIYEALFVKIPGSTPWKWSAGFSPRHLE